MKQLMLAAAVQLAKRSNNPVLTESKAIWDKTVSRVLVENGVVYDMRNPAITVRPAQVSVGKFGTDCPRFISTDRLVMANNPFALYSDFTIEGFFNFESLTRTNQYMADFGSNGFIIRYYKSGAVDGIVVDTGGSTRVLESHFIPTPGVWYHVAVVRFGSSLTLYIDGVAQASAIFTANMAYSSFTLGNYGGGGTYSMVGLIDQFRIVQEAVYTANFIPPSAAFPVGGEEADVDPYWGNVIALVDSTVNGQFVDRSGKHTVEHVGAVAESTTEKKIGQSGIWLPSDGSYLRLPDASNLFDFGTENWTIECWVKPTAVNAGAAQLLGRGTLSSMGGWQLILNNMRPQLRWSTNGTSWNNVTSLAGLQAIPVNKWSHIAAVRFGGSFFIFVDGEMVTSFSGGATLIASTLPVTIGNAEGGQGQLIGYFDSVRITRGVSRYVAEFTPKLKTRYAASTGTVGNGDIYWPKVKALLEFTKDISAGPDMFSIVLQRGNVLLDSEYTLFGERTLKVTSGSSGGINYSNATQTLLGNVDSTVEGWINTNYGGQTTMMPMIGQYHASTTGSWCFGVFQNKAFLIIRGGVQLYSTSTISNGQWHHLAISIKNGIVYMYVDGVLEAQAPWGAIPSYNGNIQVGYNIAAEAESGYRTNLARIRVTQGQARYTSNFIPDENTIPFNSLAA